MPEVRAPYAESTKAHDEQVLARAKFHILHWATVWALLLSMGWLVAPLWWFGRSLVRMATTEFSLTDRRIILKTGWLRRDTNEMALESIENIQIHQGAIGRLLGVGRLTVHGAGGGSLRSPPIAEVLRFRRELENALSAHEPLHASSSGLRIVNAAHPKSTQHSRLLQG